MGSDEYFDVNDMNELNEEYNNWLERLYGNYVLLIELYVERRNVFTFETLHFIILIFHGVALQKLETKFLEEYLEAIDDLVDGIHYKAAQNPKYKHIPLRIKYLFMDVQEHIETTN